APFRRNLHVSEGPWIGQGSSDEVRARLRSTNPEQRRAALDEVVGLPLRNRDLRYAVFYRADLPKADLRGANLAGADLRLANLAQANLDPLDIDVAGRCVSDAQRRYLEGFEEDQFALSDDKPSRPYCVANLRDARLDL